MIRPGVCPKLCHEINGSPKTLHAERRTRRSKFLGAAWSLFAGCENEVVRARLPGAGQLCFKPSRTGRLIERFPLLLFVFGRPNSPALE